MCASWAVLVLSWTAVGTSWGALGSLWVRQESSESRKSEQAKNFEKNNENQRFWPLQALPGRLSGLSWASLERSWEPGEPSEGCLGLLGSVLGCLFAFWGLFGGVLGRPGPVWGLPGRPGGAVPGACDRCHGGVGRPGRGGVSILYFIILNDNILYYVILYYILLCDIIPQTELAKLGSYLYNKS